MKQDIRAFKIELMEGEKMVQIPISEELREKSKEFNKKYVQPEVFLKKFIGAENFKRASEKLDEALENSLPIDIKEKCKWCNGKKNDEVDKECKKYEIQSLITFKLVAVEFVDIIRGNPHVFNNKRLRFELTKEFYQSIIFYNGKGIMAVDMGRLMGKVLEMGLLSINQKLLQTKELSKNLRIINHSLHALNNDSLPYKIKGIDTPEFISKQYDFFKDQQEFYQEEQRINREEKLEKAKSLDNGSNNPRPYRTDIAYFCYYTSQSKELETENSFPSKKAWIEIANLFGKDATNIQKVYNRIYGNSEERLKQSKITNINYVFENMLGDYPEAKKLALEELRMAKKN